MVTRRAGGLWPFHYPLGYPHAVGPEQGKKVNKGQQDRERSWVLAMVLSSSVFANYGSVEVLKLLKLSFKGVFQGVSVDFLKNC
jgi:hypothetical protein